MDGRPDAIWARMTDETITLDGQLDESSWAEAESLMIEYQENAGVPGSGWRNELGISGASDPTRATVKLLASGDSLYLAAIVPDSSIGGSDVFNEFDGLLMDLRDHSVPLTEAAPPVEYFYSWWYPSGSMPDDSVGIGPTFIGTYGNFPPLGPDGSRSGQKIENWNAVTRIDGESNTDDTIDERYVVEMRFRLDQLGYDVQRAGGDTVEFNISIYDTDWDWPRNTDKFSANRSFWQDPWGNTIAYNQARVHVQPDVTTGSGEVPEIGPDVIIPNGEDFADPTIDGNLDEDVWMEADGFPIRYDDPSTFASYPGVGPYSSGQFQPSVNDQKADVVDPGETTIKWFFKGSMLYMSADMQDQSVIGRSNFNLWDGVRLTVVRRDTVNASHVPLPQALTARVDTTGEAQAEDALLALVEDGAAQLALSLGDGTTVNDPSNVDGGYQMEMAVDLTALGYPEDRGDGIFFPGVMLLDGDGFQDMANNYGTRTWWFRERTTFGSAAYAFMDPNTAVGTAIADGPSGSGDRLRLLGNAPNPFHKATTLRYALPSAGEVTVRVYDVLGRRVAKVAPGAQGAGTHRLTLRRADLPAGVYFYRVELRTGDETRRSTAGRLVRVR